MARRWRWPPDRLRPASATGASEAIRHRARNRPGGSGRGRSHSSSSEAAGFAKQQVGANRALEQVAVENDTAVTVSRSEARRYVAQVDAAQLRPSPVVGRVRAGEHAGQRRLARAALARHAHEAAGTAPRSPRQRAPARSSVERVAYAAARNARHCAGSTERVPSTPLRRVQEWRTSCRRRPCRSWPYGRATPACAGAGRTRLDRNTRENAAAERRPRPPRTAPAPATMPTAAPPKANRSMTVMEFSCIAQQAHRRAAEASPPGLVHVARAPARPPG